MELFVMKSVIRKVDFFKLMVPCTIIILNKIQLDATVCSLIYFTAESLYMFRVSQHPSSGVLKTVTATSNVARSGLVPIWSRWREVAVPILWPVPEAAVTVFSIPDDGCCDTRNM